MDTVYVLLEDYCFDCESNKTITIYKDYHMAKKQFTKLVTKYFNEYNDWIQDLDGDSYECFEAGCYNDNHINIELKEYKVLENE